MKPSSLTLPPKWQQVSPCANSCIVTTTLTTSQIVIRPFRLKRDRTWPVRRPAFENVIANPVRMANTAKTWNAGVKHQRTFGNNQSNTRSGFSENRRR